MFTIICPTCQKPFQHSWSKKRYCSNTCWLNSAQLHAKKLDAETHKKNKTRICRQCGKEFMDWQKGSKSKCCSSSCRRQWYAERFDRWKANPGEISLPQNFDEFLLQPTLPCLVRGCDWHGEHLGGHINKVHGIPVEEVKKIVGFNKRTGVIPPRLQEIMSGNARANEALMANRCCITAENASELGKVGGKTPRTPEWREHGRIAAVFNSGRCHESVEAVCRECAKLFPKRVGNKSFYCSKSCMHKASDRRKLSRMVAKPPNAVCTNCGKSFSSKYSSQVKQATEGGRIFCGRECYHETSTREKRTAGKLLLKARAEDPASYAKCEQCGASFLLSRQQKGRVLLKPGVNVYCCWEHRVLAMPRKPS